MKQMITPADKSAWRSMFEDFAQSAFRLEQLQTYTSPGEADSLARFLEGKPPNADTSWWCSMVRRHRAVGHTMSRVRVVTEPLTDYTRFELAVYPDLVEAGDDIRIILATSGKWPQNIPQHDFWLFDDRDLWLMHYEDGRLIGAELTTDPNELERHRRWRDLAIAQSIALDSFLTKTNWRAAS